MSLDNAAKSLSPRRIAIIGVPLLALVVVAGVGMARHKEPTYFTALVERGDLKSVVQATGTINAVTLVQVGSQVSGNIDKLYADFNSHVKKGQVVAQLETSLFKARLQQATADLENSKANLAAMQANIAVQEADVASCQANVEKVRAAANQAKIDLGRTMEMFKQGILPASQRDSAQTAYDSAAAALAAAEAIYQQSQAKIKSTRAAVEQARAQIAQKAAAVDASRVDLEHATIYAPIDGTVVARNVDVGQTVAASLQAPTLFTIAQDLTDMLVYVKTDESDVGNVHVGAAAEFKVDAFPKDTFHGRVKEVRINPSTVQNVVTYDTIIEFQNPNQKLLPGMTAYVTIPVAVADNTLKIPNAALRFRPEIPDEERRALLEKAGIMDASRRGMAAGNAGMAGESAGPAAGQANRPAAGGARGGPQGGGVDRSSAGGRPGMVAGAGMGGARGQGAPGAGPQQGDTQVVWKLDANKKMEPLLVRVGITDYTSTQLMRVLKGGDLKEGDTLITGMTNPNRTVSFGAMGPGGPGMGRPGMGRPGGFGRR